MANQTPRPSATRKALAILRDNVATPIVGLWERGKIERYSAAELRHQPIFIIGAPRTGSTILYQALTNYFDTLYIDNLVCRWRNNFFFGFWLSGKRFGGEPHGNFESEHGNTARFGGHAPSECGGFWYRWLPSDRHFVDDHEITEAMVEGIRREVTAVSNYFDRPLLFKNLNAGQRLRLLQRCFPGAKFIHVRRARQSTTRSIIASRKRVGVAAGEWWSIMPPNHRSLMELPEEAMVDAQVAAIDSQIDLDLQRFPPGNHRVIHFDEFSAELMEQLGEWLGLRRRRGGSLPAFRRDA